MSYHLWTKISACILVSAVVAGNTFALASPAHGQPRPGMLPPDPPSAMQPSGEWSAKAQGRESSPGTVWDGSILPQMRELGRPEVNFHPESKVITAGQSTKISLAVSNITRNSEIDVHVVVSAPPGLLLSGASCTSSGQCSEDFTLREGDSWAVEVAATGDQADIYTITATIIWTYCCVSGGYVRGPFEMQEFRDLEVLDASRAVPGDPTINLHPQRTEVSVGETVILDLSATNSIAKPSMTLRLLVKVPPGWSLGGNAFADACGGSQCSAFHEIGSGETRNLVIMAFPNEPGRKRVEAEMEWYFGNDTSTLDARVESREINVVDPESPEARSSAGGTLDDKGPVGRWFDRYWRVLVILMISVMLVSAFELATRKST